MPNSEVAKPFFDMEVIATKEPPTKKQMMEERTIKRIMSFRKTIETAQGVVTIREKDLERFLSALANCFDEVQTERALNDFGA